MALIPSLERKLALFVANHQEEAILHITQRCNDAFILKGRHPKDTTSHPFLYVITRRHSRIGRGFNDGYNPSLWNLMDVFNRIDDVSRLIWKTESDW